MKKFIYLLMTALLLLTISGCADCNHESDYDYVGVSVEQYTTKAKIKSVQLALCSNQIDTNKECAVQLNSYQRDFTVSCKKHNYNYNLKDSIHKLFPMEEYKEDKFEQCKDYYVYDFLSYIPKTEKPSTINELKINSQDPNLWYVTIDGSCYEWDMTHSLYKVPVNPVP